MTSLQLSDSMKRKMKQVGEKMLNAEPHNMRQRIMAHLDAPDGEELLEPLLMLLDHNLVQSLFSNDEPTFKDGVRKLKNIPVKEVKEFLKQANPTLFVEALTKRITSNGRKTGHELMAAALGLELDDSVQHTDIAAWLKDMIERAACLGYLLRGTEVMNGGDVVWWKVGIWHFAKDGEGDEQVVAVSGEDGDAKYCIHRATGTKAPDNSNRFSPLVN